MKINKKEFVTEASEVIALSELCENIGALGQPCLLMIRPAEVMSLDAEFPDDTPFITAIVLKTDEGFSEDMYKHFDLVVNEEEADEYADKLFKDKSRKQIEEINRCFITARKSSQEDILECESRAFYRLMADKNGGGSNE